VTRVRFRAPLWALTIGVVSLVLATFAGTAGAVSVSDFASARWDGANANSKIGSLNVANVGDINQDGRNDVLASDTTAASRGAFVLFTGGGTVDTSVLIPSRGYRIQTATTPLAMDGVGDQNGDGVPDVLVLTSAAAYVVFGISDPSPLPVCNANSPTRCLDVSSMTDTQGYAITTGGPVLSTAAGAGDVNGDGIDDVMIGSGAAEANAGAVWVVYGGNNPDADPVVLNALDPGDASQVIGPVAGSQFGSLGSFGHGLGDLDGDGFGEIAIQSPFTVGESTARFFVIRGSALAEAETLDTADFSPDQGFMIASPAPLFVSYPSNFGDVNGDGLDDLGIGGTPVLGGTGVLMVVYTPENPPADPIVVNDSTPDAGYVVTPAGGGAVGQYSGSLGDLNGDGIPDAVMSNIATSPAGVGANVVLGKRPSPSGPIEISADLDPALGIHFAGSGAAPTPLATLGDLEGDGLVDFAFTTPNVPSNGRTNSGSIYLVPGSSYMPQVRTGQASSSETGATLGIVADANGRDTEVYAEFGTTDEYGSSTAPVEAGSSNSPQSIGLDVTGLTPGTTYHFRAMAVNDLGLVVAGEDRTFTTRAQSGGGGGGCQADPTAPGCSQFCIANPQAPGCIQPTPGLSELIANVKAGKVRRGAKTQVTAWITSTGTTAARGVKICVTVPKRLATAVGKRCRTFGDLTSGKTGKAGFKVKVKPRAKRRAKVAIKLAASARDLGQKTATVRFTVR